MTTTIKCGNCKGTHDTVAAVKACYGQPVTTAQAAPVAPAATPKQVAFIERLVAERYGDPAAIAPGQTYTLLDRLFPVRTKANASALIERLLAMPKPEPEAVKPVSSKCPTPHPKGGCGCPKSESRCRGWVAYEKAQQKAQPVEGMHKVGDDIFKVQKAVHGSGHLYAKRLVPGEGYGSKARFEYAPGVLKTLSAATLMSLDEAKAWGALYGTCCVCGRTLTNEDSIDAGIGPVCAGKFA